jgi:hypothetical protein
MKRLSPVAGRGICVLAEADPNLTGPRTAAENRLAEQLRSRLTTEQGAILDVGTAAWVCTDQGVL